MSIHFPTASYLQQFAAARQDRNQAGSFSTEFSITATTKTTAAEEVQAEQTLDDVKKEFSAYLDSLAISPGLKNTPINVTISDAAFERMLTDPDYKQRMMDLCKRDMCDPAWNAGNAPKYMHVQITHDTNNQYNHEFVSHSYNYDTGPNYEAETRNAFWSKKAKKSDDSQKIREKRLEEKKQLEAIMQSIQDRRKMLVDSWQGSLFSGISGYSGYQTTSDPATFSSFFAEA